MKKVLLTVLLAFVAVSGYSQLSLDVRAGMSMNNFTKLETDMKVGYTVGLGVDYAITDMWSFRSGLMFTGKGAKVSGEESLAGITAKGDYKLKPHYLDIPLMAALKLPIAGDTKFVINAGPYLGIGLGGKETIEVSAAGEKANSDAKFFDSADRFDIGLQYGVGVEFGKILVNLNGQYGFISPFDDSSSKNLNFILSVGYRFK